MTNEPTLTLTIPDVPLSIVKDWALPWTPARLTYAAKAALEVYEREHRPYYVVETDYGYSVWPENGGQQQAFIRKTVPDAKEAATELCERLNREEGK